MKLIVVIPDGMTDLPVKELNNKTPLEKAITPNIDSILRNGITGIVYTIPSGVEPGSDIANLSILGVNPAKTDIGRGALEALAQNIEIKKDEYVFRANFVYVKDNIMLDYTGGNIKTTQAKKLIELLNKNFDSKVRFIPGVDYRNLAIVRNNKAIKVVTTPPHNIINKKIDKYLPEGKSATIIKEIMFRTYEILSRYPLKKRITANMMWLWGEGKVNNKHITPFYRKYKLRGAVISAVDIIRGIGKLLDMDIIQVPGITGDFRTNYKNKAIYALKNLKKYDFIYIHIEAPDEAGHQANYKEKIRAIEKIDRLIIKPLLESKEKFNILFLPDHPTPIIKRTHINHPVPFILYSKEKNLLPNHNFKEFNENIIPKSTLKVKKGYKLLEWVLKYLKST